MIKVTIELISARGKQYNRKLGEVHIANDGARTIANPKEADYNVRFYDRAGRHYKSKRIERWKRKSKSVMQLMGEVFNG